MQIYKSDFQEIEYFESEKMLRKAWYTTSENMEDEKFKIEVIKIAEKIEEVKPIRMCDVTTNFLYTISPDLQTWVDTDVFPRFIAAGLKRYAIIMSTEFVSQLSIEQTMEEGVGNQFQVQYFDSEDKAKEWLLKY